MTNLRRNIIKSNYALQQWNNTISTLCVKENLTLCIKDILTLCVKEILTLRVKDIVTY